MDKNTMQQKKKRENLFQLLKLLVIFVLFVISSFVNEILGMMMLGVLIFYVIIGNDSHKVEHKAYEEILQSKREMLNYDRKIVENEVTDRDRQSHLKKHHLIVIVLMFVMMCVISCRSIEVGMLIFGCIIFYVLYVSE